MIQMTIPQLMQHKTELEQERRRRERERVKQDKDLREKESFLFEALTQKYQMDAQQRAHDGQLPHVAECNGESTASDYVSATGSLETDRYDGVPARKRKKFDKPPPQSQSTFQLPRASPRKKALTDYEILAQAGENEREAHSGEDGEETGGEEDGSEMRHEAEEDEGYEDEEEEDVAEINRLLQRDGTGPKEKRRKRTC
jgi:hypothetical protein